VEIASPTLALAGEHYIAAPVRRPRSKVESEADGNP
jgi:hypothetical protein